MTYKQAVFQYLSSNKNLSHAQKERVQAVKEIDKIRKINKSLPIENSSKHINSDEK